MSDPEEHIEIEDTLSSIRRLVTEEDRNGLDTFAANETPGERLVLTPALRVADELDQSRDQTGQAKPLFLKQQTSPDQVSGKETDAFVGDETAHRSESPRKTGSFVALSSRIAALETAIAETDDQWEPDGSVGDDYAGTNVGTITWPDDGDTGGDVPSSQKTGAADSIQTDAQPDLSAVTDALMESETLQELVADIVRKELQGELGERITRNIRKLVRREIHRAMAAQELD